MFAKIKAGKKHPGRGHIETDSTGFPVRVYTRDRQIGKSNLRKDRAIRALTPGKRISAETIGGGGGNVYYEYRRNRSDRNRTTKV